MVNAQKNTGPSEPSVQTIKRLFGESGNLCAFPNCAQALISDSAVIGKVCHIKGRKPGSPRYDATQSDQDRHGYGNLVLMCGVHHDVIDNDEKSYTVERLHEIKSAHLEKAAKLSDEEAERGALILFSSPITSVNQSGGITASLVTVNNYNLVAYNDKGRVYSKPQFPAVQPQEGEARFRKSTAPLGMTWNRIRIPKEERFDVTLARGRAVWLRLIPVNPLQYELGPLDLKSAAIQPNFFLMPLVDSDPECLIAEDGFGVCNRVDHSQGNITSGITFAFITGEVWGIDTSLLNFDDTIYFDEIEKYLTRGFRGYTTFLDNLGIKPPFRWIAGIEGVLKMRLAFEGQGSFSHYFDGPICMSPTVADGGLFEGTEDASAALAPFFDKIFRRSGAARPARLQNPAR